MPDSLINQGPRRDAVTPAWKVFAIPALLALAGYIFFYACDARLRSHRGPWEVTFLVTPGDTPAVRIDQPLLGISNVVVRFRGERLPAGVSNLPATVRFDQPGRPVPFGTLAFDDLMYQPGTVVLHCFGHEVQMLPRALFLNRTRTPWATGSTFDLSPTGKLASLEPASRRRPAPRSLPPPAGGPTEAPTN